MIPTAVSAALIGVLGLLIGSFLNVVVYRVPQGVSVAWPGSYCPLCNAPIRARHNVPVLSWIVLRGRCPDCAAAISIRYPLIEAGTAVAYVLVVLRWPHQPRWWPALLFLAALSIALTAIDIDVHRLPDVLVLPSYSVLAGLLVIPGDWHALLRGAAGCAVLLGVYGLIWLAARGAMGRGDVTLAGLVGMATAYASWGTLIVGWFAAFLLGSAVGLVLLAARRATRRTAVPFGPFMLLGCWVALLGAGTLGDWYLHRLR